MPEAETPDVVVHGGIHKTATSYIQSILQRNAGRLRKRGVHYVHHRDTRKLYTIPVQLNAYEKIGMDFRRKVPDADLVEAANGFFGGIGAAPGDRILISDENMTGHAGHCVKNGRPYRWSHILLPIFAQNVPYPVTELHLALRNYADFFASIYVEYLRSAKGDDIVMEAEMKRAVLSKMPNWMRLIEQCRKAFTDAQIILWRHEDFSDLSGRILQNLAGPAVDGTQMAMPKRTRGRPSASHRAVEELLREINRLGGDAALARRVEIQEAFPRGPQWPGYDPWSQAERAHLMNLYERDMEKIAAMDRVTVLSV